MSETTGRRTMAAQTAFATAASLTSGLSHIHGTPAMSRKPLPRVAKARTRRSIVTAGLFDMWSQDKNVDIVRKFEHGYAYLAHPEKGSGEDAFFIEGNCAGVFDGVSGAADAQGVDPRLYSQTLAALTSEKARAYGPQSVVKAAMEASTENDQIGASTACVVGMDEVGRLFGVNLGDSGVMIIRNGKKIFRTKEQQHFFNCPYQLTSMSNAGYNSGDGIAMGQNVQEKLKVGDWVILATDGLFDNTTNEEIVQVTSQAASPAQLADDLGELAMKNSQDQSYFSPFARAAQKANVDWQGGKLDDITIVTLRVTDDANQQSATLLSKLPDPPQ